MLLFLHLRTNPRPPNVALCVQWASPIARSFVQALRKKKRPQNLSIVTVALPCTHKQLMVGPWPLGPPFFRWPPEGGLQTTVGTMPTAFCQNSMGPKSPCSPFFLLMPSHVLLPYVQSGFPREHFFQPFRPELAHLILIDQGVRPRRGTFCSVELQVTIMVKTCGG